MDAIAEARRILRDAAHVGPETRLNICDNLIARFGGSTDPNLRFQVLRATVAKARACASPWVDRRGDALDLFDDVLSRLESDTNAADTDHAALVSEAMLGKIECLNDLKRHDESLATSDALADRFAQSSVPALFVHFFKARFVKMETLISLKRTAEALEVCDDTLLRATDDPELRDITAQLRLERGSVLYATGEHSAALQAYDQMLDHLGAGPAAPALELTCRGLNGKGAALAALGWHEEAVAAYDQMLSRNEANELLTADTLMSKANALATLKRRDDALAAFDRLIEHCTERSRYRMADDYAAWVLKRMRGDAISRREQMSQR